MRALCWFSYAFIHNFYDLLIIQFFLGAGEAIGSPSFDAIFAKHLDKGKEINEYSKWKIVYNAGLIMGTLTGGFVAHTFGFRVLFFLMALLAVISFFGIFLKPRKLL
jgi:MFS family permease